MSASVILTIFLYQKGSSESKTPSTTEHVDVIAGNLKNSGVPWPVRNGGFVLKVYENSLSIALGFLFLVSFTLHAWGWCCRIQSGARPA